MKGKNAKRKAPLFGRINGEFISSSDGNFLTLMTLKFNFQWMEFELICQFSSTTFYLEEVKSWKIKGRASSCRHKMKK